MKQHRTRTNTYSTIPSHCDVVIIGGGVSGASAAYHLAKYTSKEKVLHKIIVLERGRLGEGLVTVPPAAGVSVADRTAVCMDTKGNDNNAMPTAFDLQFAKSSGTNVLPTLRTIKQITRLYATSSQDFIKHHGKDGARKYLKLSSLGMQYQKDLASTLLPCPEKQLRCNGALYLTFDDSSIPILEEEFHTLRELGCSNIKFLTRDDELLSIPGCPPLAVAGIYLPDDAIIDSAQYAKSLLDKAGTLGNVQVIEQCPEVISTWTSPNDNTKAITELSTGARIVSQHVVVATGGLFLDNTLAGILQPSWSYLVGIPHPEREPLTSSNITTSTVNYSSKGDSFSDGTPYNSCNFYTWGFTHDWCWSEGAVRISGEDHFSAYKPPQSAIRYQSLTQFVQKSYANIAFQLVGENHAKNRDVEETLQQKQYGVYSETPDKCPIVGLTNDKSRICYLVGCNAWGQAALSYCATLIPGLLGYGSLDDTQKDLLSLVTIQRFSLLPSVHKHSKL
jgi:glycine/D-amino acid oxidase-like deaminating enzyme